MSNAIAAALLAVIIVYVYGHVRAWMRHRRMMIELRKCADRAREDAERWAKIRAKIGLPPKE